MRVQIIFKRLAPALALLFVVACSPASASTSRDSSDSTTGDVVPVLTATEISDAVLFNTGAAAVHLVDLHRGDTRMSDELRLTQQALNSEMARDPGGPAIRHTNARSRSRARGRGHEGSAAVLARTVIAARHGPERVDEVMLRFNGDALQERLIKATALDVGIETWMDKNLSGDISDMVDVVETLFLVWVIDRPSANGVTIREIMVRIVTEKLAVGARA